MLLGKERLAPDTGGSPEEFWRWLSRLLGPSLAERARTQTEQIQPQGMQRPALARAHAPALLAEINQAMGQTTPTQSISPQEPESGGTISWNATGPFREREFQVKKFTGKPRGEYEDLLDTLRWQLETEIATNFGEIPGYAGSGDAGRQRAGMLASLLTAMQNAQKVGSESADPLAKERLQAESNERIAQTAADATRFRATEGRTATENSARTRGEGQLDKAQYDALAELINADPPPDPSDPEFAKWLMRMMFKRRFLSGDMGGEQEVQQG